ncbi:S9 family peptidase [Subtercola endophyticus]|uniref:S9 family peptidase n=1 Tax=Subtercola endophyticus TaxID=2895559 RepID=UPI001E4F8313|nr:S9 family peptidase [Subtercola endophyticus]UFS60110.1 S9 family peptidase [Subtercola endophyticus]
MAPLTPPVARKQPLTRLHHGDEFVDDYEWLRDKENPDVLAHLSAENDYTEQQNAHLAVLRDSIFDEIKNRTLETDLSVPVREGDWWYYTRTLEGKQYGIHARAPIAAPDDWTPPVLEAGQPITGEQVLLDDNIEAEGTEFYSLGSFDVSADATLLAYAVDTEGDERYTLRIRDLATGADLADVVENTAPGATFSPDARFIFYPTVDESWRPDTIWRHRVGTPASDDVVVFTEPDERYWIGVGLTRSRKYLEIGIGSSITSESLLLDASTPEGEFSVVWPRVEGVEYSVEHAVVAGTDRLLITHNANGENFELVEVALDAPTDPERQHTILAHSHEVRLESVDAFATHLSIEYRRDALSRVAVITLAPAQVGSGWPYSEPLELPFDEPLFAVGTGGNPEFDQPTLRVGFTSFVTPSTVYDYVVATGELRQLKQQPVLGGYDSSLYGQRREWAVAPDGTRVPISLVYRLDADGDATPGSTGTSTSTGTTAPAAASAAEHPAPAPKPLVLYGYGSYEASIDPYFSVARLSLLDRGVVFAIAHVRGGGELGRWWYENGKTLTKRNTFSDFIASARHLIEIGETTPELLVAQGGSAGGLLMGAVANDAPELFAGILAQVPFVDALTSILDPSLPLTVIEWDEWGDPLHDPEVYAYMKSYSPYENVHAGIRYPRILAVTSLNDTRVLYVEPAKWVAKLREAGAPALLKIEMSAGHGGVSGRYERWKETAYEYAWVLDVLGLAD